MISYLVLCRDRSEMSTPSFPSEIFGMFIESLGEDPDDQRSLFACSLVSSWFRHLCGPVLYREIVLDRWEQVDNFIEFGERSDALQYVKSFTLASSNRPHKILPTISRKASLETLRLRQAMFYGEPLTASLLSGLSTVTALILRDCRFWEFEDFVFFIRCFPLCRVLRLRACTWTRRGDATSEVRNLPAYNVAPVHLEITKNSRSKRDGGYCDQNKVLGAAPLGLARLRSFTYEVVVGVGPGSELVLEKIAGCELLEEIEVVISHSVGHGFGERESSPRLFNPELAELIEISDFPAHPLLRSHQIPHHPGRIWTASRVDARSRRGFSAFSDH